VQREKEVNETYNFEQKRTEFKIQQKYQKKKMMLADYVLQMKKKRSKQKLNEENKSDTSSSELDFDDPEIQAALGAAGAANPQSLLSEALGLEGDGLDWGQISSPAKRGRKRKIRPEVESSPSPSR